MNDIINNQNRVGIKLVIVKILRKSNVILFIFLSIYFNPFVAVAFNRKGNFAYNGLSARDWRLFILSVIISNGFWSTTVFAGISFFDFLYKILLSWWNG
jgi:hypothetical protein